MRSATRLKRASRGSWRCEAWASAAFLGCLHGIALPCAYAACHGALCWVPVVLAFAVCFRLPSVWFPRWLSPCVLRLLSLLWFAVLCLLPLCFRYFGVARARAQSNKEKS